MRLMVTNAGTKTIGGFGRNVNAFEERMQISCIKDCGESYDTQLL